jgi:hypothetical protein
MSEGAYIVGRNGDSDKPPRIVINPDFDGGRETMPSRPVVRDVPITSTPQGRSGGLNAGTAVTAEAFASPRVTLPPRESTSLPTTPVASPPPVKKHVRVTFEREGRDGRPGDVVEAVFHEVVIHDDGLFLTLVYDHEGGSQFVYRPAFTDEALAVCVHGEDNRPDRVFLCFATGYRLRHGRYEYQALTIGDGAMVEGR